MAVVQTAQTRPDAAANLLACDGQGGWTDEGPDNDLHTMPAGVLSLYGVPIPILLSVTGHGTG